MSSAAPNSNRQALVVIGMHRSGTSALARTLSFLGASLPRQLMPARPDNPLGFWESDPIGRFNEELSNTALRRWDDPKRIPDAWFAQPERQADIERAAELLLQEFSDSCFFVIKDPRLSRLLPVWKIAFRLVDIRPFFLIMLRNPKEISFSLLARNEMPVEQAQLLWLNYMLAAEEGSRGYPRMVVSYANLLRNWRKALSRVADNLGLEESIQDDGVAGKIDDFLSESHRHYIGSDTDLQADPRYSEHVKELYRVFSCGVEHGTIDLESIDSIRARQRDAWELFAPGDERTPFFRAFADDRGVAAIECPDGKQISVAKAGEAKRHLILHYHLFKNAGTSIDSILQENFGDRWCEHEGDGGAWPDTSVREYLLDNSDIEALSSHTAQLPVPNLPNTIIFPIVFLRHPIDRIRSVYEFERKQQAETEGAVMAKKLNMADFVAWRLERQGDRSFRNFQVYRLSYAMSGAYRRDNGELDSAERALEALPFVGLVENFDQSLVRMSSFLKPCFPDLTISKRRENVIQKAGTTLEDRLQVVQDILGPQLYDQLMAANELDLALYRRVRSTYG